MIMDSFKIKAVAKQVPEKVVTNDDLAEILDTSDDWIRRRTGIRRRHVASGLQNTNLCTAVANRLLAKAGVAATDLDFIIVATMSPDYQTPATAAQVQGRLGAKRAVAFDINAACAGFVYGTVTLHRLLQQTPHGMGLIIGSEQLSKLLDWHDRSTAVLFGDGASGMLVANDASESRMLATDLQTFGEDSQAITAGQFGVCSPFSAEKVPAQPAFQMDGHRVYNFAKQQVPASIRRALIKANLTTDQIKYFVLHQANARIIDRIAKQLDVPSERFPQNIAEYGNTAAASEPLVLNDLVEQQCLKRGDLLVLSGFGGGLTVGTIILRY
ncbi:beta-ketoacyl-ACP synthase 3 [Fructilactobacillus florum]|nr:beta-ketoacyl-ACP synthase 3 [Fructilactobacillus florum]